MQPVKIKLCQNTLHFVMQCLYTNNYIEIIYLVIILKLYYMTLLLFLDSDCTVCVMCKYCILNDAYLYAFKIYNQLNCFMPLGEGVVMFELPDAAIIRGFTWTATG